MSLQSVQRLLPDLKRLRTEVVLLSGGEPLLNPDWPRISASLRGNGQKLWLATSGLSLAKNARRVAEQFDAVTVSLDGADRDTYETIRGLDAFEIVCRGIRAVAAAGLAAGIRVTLQRANYRQIPDFIELARTLEALEVSFLAVDVASPHAFGRVGGFAHDLALRDEDLPLLDGILRSFERDHQAAFRSGFIAQSPQKLRSILQYFSALCGKHDFPRVRCNAPEFSAVLDARGGVNPCFFISGAPASAAAGDLDRAVNSDGMAALRHSIRAGQRAECLRCVCSLWREPESSLPLHA